MGPGRLMGPGSHACRGILFPDWLMPLNYQSGCLSTVFAWILIGPRSVLTRRGECVGDGQRKCVHEHVRVHARVRVCEMYPLASVSYTWDVVTRVECVECGSCTHTLSLSLFLPHTHTHTHKLWRWHRSCLQSHTAPPRAENIKCKIFCKVSKSENA